MLFRSDEIVIQIGNSGDCTNNHIEIINNLKKYKEDNIKIIVPLNYGNKEYIEKVVIEGKRIFGEKFQPILNHLDMKKYYELLSNVDVAIMNHLRQQAAGNIVILLYLGKKVYLNSMVTTYKTFKEWNLYVGDIKNIEKLELSELPKMSIEKIKNNKLIIEDKFNNTYMSIYNK